MEPEDLVRRHYSGDDLERVALDALRSRGVDVESLQIDDLAGLDQLHAGAAAATEELLDSLELSAASRVLDVGCGVGGPARMAASRSGCSVTGIDLSSDFTSLARSLTESLGLSQHVRFVVGSATALPYDTGAFDRAMLNHAGMNMPDKQHVFTEIRRVLITGGLFALYEQMRIGDGELAFPLPWADDETSSFVETRSRYAEMLTKSGFEIVRDEDRTVANAANGPTDTTRLSPGDLFGPGFEERLRNNIVAAMTGTLGAVLMVGKAI